MEGSDVYKICFDGLPSDARKLFEACADGKNVSKMILESNNKWLSNITELFTLLFSQPLTLDERKKVTRIRDYVTDQVVRGEVTYLIGLKRMTVLMDLLDKYVPGLYSTNELDKYRVAKEYKTLARDKVTNWVIGTSNTKCCFIDCDKTERLKLCRSCMVISYCSPECQKRDWKSRHKQQCKEIQEKLKASKLDQFL
jgi:hypothetical protein